MPSAMLEPMKNRLFYRPPILQVLDDDSLEQGHCDIGVPDTFWVHDDDRPVAADAKAGSLTPLHTRGSEQQVLTLQQLGES